MTKYAHYDDGPEATGNHAIFDAMASGEFEEALDMALADPSILVTQRNEHGATPVHFAFLLKHNDLGKEFVLMNPEAVTQRYTGPHFEDENSLHIAIIQQNPELVEWLITRAPSLLDDETKGAFFRPGELTYLGGYPLLFAVSTNQSRIVQIILEKGGLDYLLAEDSHGNNALHMTVIHELPEMYNFVTDLVSQRTRTRTHSCFVNFVHRVNRERLSPLTLAAAMGKVKMFQHILEKESHFSWEYGGSLCRRYPLRGLEQPYEVSGVRLAYTGLQCLTANMYRSLTKCNKMDGHTLPESVRQGRLQCVGLKPVKRLIDEKWRTTGRQKFAMRFLISVAIQALWTVSTWISNHYSDAPNNLSKFPLENGFIITLEGLIMLLLTFELFMAWKGIFRGGCNFIFQASFLQVDTVINTMFAILWFIQWGLQLGGYAQQAAAFGMFAALFGCVRVLFQLVAFRLTGTLVITMREMTKYDLIRFFMVLTILISGFSLAFLIVLVRSNQVDGLRYFDIFKNFLFFAIGGNTAWPGYPSVEKSWMTSMLNILFLLLLALFMSRVLLVMLMGSYNRIMANAELQFYLEKINILRVFEGEMAAKEMHRRRELYGKTFKVPRPLEYRDENCTICGGSPEDDGADGLGKPKSRFPDLYLDVVTKNEKWLWQKNVTSVIVDEQAKRAALFQEEYSLFKDIVFLKRTHKDLVGRQPRRSPPPAARAAAPTAANTVPSTPESSRRSSVDSPVALD